MICAFRGALPGPDLQGVGPGRGNGKTNFDSVSRCAYFAPYIAWACRMRAANAAQVRMAAASRPSEALSAIRSEPAALTGG